MPFDGEVIEQTDSYGYTCPYCLEYHGDAWELLLDTTWVVTECFECGRKFTVAAENTVTYTSRPVRDGDK
jgi:DNA-directed RNA polymerase subunit RPC12/RpoP